MMLWFALLGGAAAVTLPSGQYHGLDDGQTTAYYSIPYATAARFQNPGPVPKGNHVVNASRPGPACINFAIPPPYNIGLDFNLTYPQSEDCLHLDVYVPHGHGDLPVLFFTPGGGFIQGASSIYDMRPLIKRSMCMHQPFIGVVINYRLGPLGFLNVGDIFNQGLLDQFAALRWVHDNIAAFGGDADRLVIMGQSAGAESVIHQLLNATVPFRGAWMMSVPSASPPFLLSAPVDNYVVPSYAAACGCTTDIVNCLRTVNTSTLVAQSDAWQGSGVGFGGVIRENVFRQLQHPIQTPVVLSTCRDEGTSEAIGFNASSDAITDIAIESLAYGINDTNFQPAMLQAYPNDPALGCPYDGRNTTYGQPSQFKRMAAIFTDGTYAEPWTEYLQLFPRAWGVLFEQPLTNNPAYGVQHGSDVPYYFPSISNHTFSPQLTATMQSALIRFVSDLNPGWPLYSATQRVVSIKEGETKEIKPPDRPGFAVIKKYLRPK